MREDRQTVTQGRWPLLKLGEQLLPGEEGATVASLTIISSIPKQDGIQNLQAFCTLFTRALS